MVELEHGDPQAAEDRLRILNSMKLLPTVEEAVELAEVLLKTAALPQKAAADALHVGIAATRSVLLGSGRRGIV